MKYLISLLLFLPVSVSAQEVILINGNKFCAYVLSIPYASDNITNEEWEDFQKCLRLLKRYETIK